MKPMENDYWTKKRIQKAIKHAQSMGIDPRDAAHVYLSTAEHLLEQVSPDGNKVFLLKFPDDHYGFLFRPLEGHGDVVLWAENVEKLIGLVKNVENMDIKKYRGTPDFYILLEKMQGFIKNTKT